MQIQNEHVKRSKVPLYEAGSISGLSVIRRVRVEDGLANVDKGLWRPVRHSVSGTLTGFQVVDSRLGTGDGHGASR